MQEDSPFAPRAIVCLLHRKQKITHICTELNCQFNPFLCNICIGQGKWKSQHSHELSIRPVNQGIEWFAFTVKGQSKVIQQLYERSIGNRQFEFIRFNLQKGNYLVQQMDNRVDNLRIQLQLELELLIKQFQKQMQLQKQEFLRKLQQYKRLFVNNIQFIKKQCIELITFQNSLRFYNNPNNLTLKLINETEKKSHEWFLMQKKVLFRVIQALDSPSFSNNLIHILSKVNKSNLLLMPNWKGERKDVQIERDIRVNIKNTINAWIQLPQILDLQQLKYTEYSPSNKFISYPIPVS